MYAICMHPQMSEGRRAGGRRHGPCRRGWSRLQLLPQRYAVLAAAAATAAAHPQTFLCIITSLGGPAARSAVSYQPAGSWEGVGERRASSRWSLVGVNPEYTCQTYQDARARRGYQDEDPAGEMLRRRTGLDSCMESSAAGHGLYASLSAAEYTWKLGRGNSYSCRENRLRHKLADLFSVSTQHSSSYSLTNDTNRVRNTKVATKNEKSIRGWWIAAKFEWGSKIIRMEQDVVGPSQRCEPIKQCSVPGQAIVKIFIFISWNFRVQINYGKYLQLQL